MERAADSTVVDPEGHRVVFENDHVRILEIRSEQGRVIPMHSHPPRAIVAITSYRIKSIDPAGVETAVERHAGDVVWSEAQEHAAEMLTSGHTIEVEVKAVREGDGDA